MTTLRLKLLVGAMCVLFVAACSTPQHKALRSIDVGMDKADVLEKLGNPTRKTRHQGQDRWSYEYQNESGMQLTHIYFAGGKVTYVGDADAPKQKFTPVANPPEKFKPVGD